jgi:hypothetical protein
MLSFGAFLGRPFFGDCTVPVLFITCSTVRPAAFIFLFKAIRLSYTGCFSKLYFYITSLVSNVRMSKSFCERFSRLTRLCFFTAVSALAIFILLLSAKVYKVKKYNVLRTLCSAFLMNCFNVKVRAIIFEECQCPVPQSIDAGLKGL